MQAADLPNDYNLSMAGAKGKKRKRKRPTVDKAQSERFIMTTKELDAAKDGRVFERALDTILPPDTKKKAPKSR